MPNAYTDVFNAAAFQDFVSELNRFEKFKHSRPHYPETLWHRALSYAEERHSARTLSKRYVALDALKLPRAPTTAYHEKLYTESIPRMNGKPLRLASA